MVKLAIYPAQTLDPYEYLRISYKKKQSQIQSRLKEFEKLFERCDDYAIFEELIFCILTSNTGAKMGLAAVDAIRDILLEGTEEELYGRLKNKHRYPNQSSYIVTTREFLKREYSLKMRDLILCFDDHQERRDFFAITKEIKGIGFKQASHFLRNIGLKGYAILDKHVIRSLYEFGIISSPKPPTTRNRYLEIEDKLKDFARKLGIDFDEIDLLLWSEKTGKILK